MTATYLYGFTAFGCLVIGLFFTRFWRSTGDRFFALMAVAFGMFAVNRTALGLIEQTGEGSPALYLVRLAAFVLIIVAIVDRERSAGDGAP